MAPPAVLIPHPKTNSYPSMVREPTQRYSLPLCWFPDHRWIRVREAGKLYSNSWTTVNPVYLKNDMLVAGTEHRCGVAGSAHLLCSESFRINVGKHVVHAGIKPSKIDAFREKADFYF